MLGTSCRKCPIKEATVSFQPWGWCAAHRLCFLKQQVTGEQLELVWMRMHPYLTSRWHTAWQIPNCSLEKPERSGEGGAPQLYPRHVSPCFIVANLLKAKATAGIIIYSKNKNQLANVKYRFKIKSWGCRLRKGNPGKRCSWNYTQHWFLPDRRAHWILGSDSMHKVVSFSSFSGFSIMRCQERCQVDQAVLRSYPLSWFNVPECQRAWFPDTHRDFHRSWEKEDLQQTNVVGSIWNTPHKFVCLDNYSTAGWY